MTCDSVACDSLVCDSLLACLVRRSACVYASKCLRMRVDVLAYARIRKCFHKCKHTRSLTSSLYVSSKTSSKRSKQPRRMDYQFSSMDLDSNAMYDDRLFPVRSLQPRRPSFEADNYPTGDWHDVAHTTTVLWHLPGPATAAIQSFSRQPLQNMTQAINSMGLQNSLPSGDINYITRNDRKCDCRPAPRIRNKAFAALRDENIACMRKLVV